MNSIAVPTVNRRELLYYLLFATVGVWLVVLVGLALWYMWLPAVSSRVLLGRVDDFPVSLTPYRQNVQVDERTIPLWVVHTPEQLTVFSALLPTPADWRFSTCIFAWNQDTQRFEDPCTGAKFALTGEILDDLGVKNLRALDFYPVDLVNNELWLDIGQKQLGQQPPP